MNGTKCTRNDVDDVLNDRWKVFDPYDVCDVNGNYKVIQRGM
jgi:hypothetical protein